LIVPRQREDCMIRVKSRVLTWREGETIVFDDTRKHEVSNMTDEQRSVLLLHVRRPVRFPGNLASRGFLAAVRHSPFIRDALRNQAVWEQGHEGR
jgi:beta-hydroxylase